MNQILLPVVYLFIFPIEASKFLVRGAPFYRRLRVRSRRLYSCITTNQHLLIKAWNLFAFWGRRKYGHSDATVGYNNRQIKSATQFPKKKKKKGSTTGEECATLCCDAFVDGFGYDTATHDYKLVMMGDLISLGYTEFTVL